MSKTALEAGMSKTALAPYDAPYDVVDSLGVNEFKILDFLLHQAVLCHFNQVEFPLWVSSPPAIVVAPDGQQTDKQDNQGPPHDLLV